MLFIRAVSAKNLFLFLFLNYNFLTINIWERLTKVKWKNTQLSTINTEKFKKFDVKSLID